MVFFAIQNLNNGHLMKVPADEYVKTARNIFEAVREGLQLFWNSH